MPRLSNLFSVEKSDENWNQSHYNELETLSTELWVRYISPRRDNFWCKVSTRAPTRDSSYKRFELRSKTQKMRLYLLISRVFSLALPRSTRSVAKNRIGSRFLLTYGLENSRKKAIIPSIQEQYRKFLSRKSIRCKEGAKNKFCKMLSTK